MEPKTKTVLEASTEEINEQNFSLVKHFESFIQICCWNSIKSKSQVRKGKIEIILTVGNLKS
jgi:hypothetical protein